MQITQKMVKKERSNTSGFYRRKETDCSGGGYMVTGLLWQTLDGTMCRIEPAQYTGQASCTGCYYHKSDGTVDCHMVPSCKWWTRPDKKNIIYKPIKEEEKDE